MVWILTIGRKKKVRSDEGPLFYTKELLKMFYKLTGDSRYKRWIKLIEAKNFSLYKKESNIGLVENEEKAIKRLSKFIEERIKLKDKSFYLDEDKFIRKVKRIFKDFSKRITYQGDYEALVNHLIWKARKQFGWKK